MRPDAWRDLLRPTPVRALLVANLVPLLGVALLGWRLSEVLLLYWAESAVIGLYTGIKLGLVARWLALFLVPFFALHYGGFMAAHLVFLVFFFTLENGGADLLAFLSLAPPILLPLGALLVSHGVSFRAHFLRGPERDLADIPDVMRAPYRRIIVMHVTIIGTGVLLTLTGSPVWGVALLVLLKTGVDLRAHLKEHRAAPRSATPAAHPDEPLTAPPP